MKVFKTKNTLEIIFTNEYEVDIPLIKEYLKAAIKEKISLTHIKCSYGGLYLSIDKVNKMKLKFEALKTLIKNQIKNHGKNV